MKRLSILLVLLAGCSPAPSSRKLDEYVPPPPPVSSYAGAIALSKETGKPVFLYFGAEWCPPCRQMKATTLQDPAVKQKLAGFVVWMVDVDSDQDLARQYKVSSIPTYMLIDGNEKPIITNQGFRDAASFIKWLGTRDKA